MKFTVKHALGLWLLLWLIVSVHSLLPRKQGKLYITFASAGEHFWHEQPLYGDFPETHDQYRYSPFVAALLGPWHWLPPWLGGILWRGCLVGAVIISCRWWQDIFPGIPWWHVLILSLPLIAPNIKNGQVNPYVFLLMTGAVCGALRGNFWRAAWSLALAVAFKVYPISLGLLLLIIYPSQLLLRLLIASAVLFFLPLFLKWDYSWQQYLLWFEKLASEDRTMQSIDRGYRDFQKILMTWGLPTSIRTYRIMEVLAGMVLAAICLKWRGLVFTPRSERTMGQFALFSSLLWCTLFGPATESATYMMLAIPAAWAFLIGATTGGNNRFLAYLGYGLLLAMLIGQWFPKEISYHVRVVNPQPYGAIALGIWLIWYFRQQKVTVAGDRPPHST